MLQKNLATNKIKQQIFFLIRVEFLGCYNTTPPTRDLVPRPRTIQGRGGEGKERSRSQHHQQGTLLHVERRSSVGKLSVERRRRRKTKPSEDQEEEKQ